MKKSHLLVFAFSLVTFSAFAQEGVKADREAVNAACSTDAQTAGCGSEVVGKGLLKCLHNYKKEHKEFKFSESCKSSMKKLRSDRKAKKAKK